jgi:hypothetical protein
MLKQNSVVIHEVIFNVHIPWHGIQSSPIKNIYINLIMSKKHSSNDIRFLKILTFYLM